MCTVKIESSKVPAKLTSNLNILGFRFPFPQQQKKKRIPETTQTLNQNGQLSVAQLKILSENGF